MLLPSLLTLAEIKTIAPNIATAATTITMRRPIGRPALMSGACEAGLLPICYPTGWDDIE